MALSAAKVRAIRTANYATVSGVLSMTGLPGNAYVGDNGVFTPAINGGSAPYVVTLILGSLPPGRSLSNNAVSGTYTTAGTYSYTLRATDSKGVTADLIVIMSVSARTGGSVLPLMATIPAFYDVPNTEAMNVNLYNVPPPRFSLGLPPNDNSVPSTKLYVDTTYLGNGGTGYLTDDLLEFTGYGGNWGRGDSMGFGVQPDGELVLTSELDFVNRASGPTRTMTWVQQKSGQPDLRQRITLTVDPTKARLYDPTKLEARRVSSDPTNPAYYYIPTVDADYSFVQTYLSPPVAGITFAVGVTDAKIFAGQIKKAIKSGSALTQDIVLHDALASFFTVQQGIGEDQPKNGRASVPTLTATSNLGTERVCTGFDFRGLWIGKANQSTGVGSTIKYRDCLMDASALNLYLTYTSPGGVGPDNMFRLADVQVDTTDPTGKRLTASNIADLITSSNAAGFPLNRTRVISPSQPGTQGDTLWNAQNYGSQNALTLINSSGITLRDSVLRPGITGTFVKGAAGGKDKIPRPAGINPVGGFKVVAFAGLTANSVNYASAGYTITSDGFIDWSTATSQPATGATVSYSYSYLPQFPAGMSFIVGPIGISATGEDVFQKAYQIQINALDHMMEGCSIDAKVDAARFGSACTNFIPLGSTGCFGPLVDANGNFGGMRYCKVTNANHDIVDIPGGYRGYNVLTSACRADGSHVDSMQIGGITNAGAASFVSEFEYHRVLRAYYDQSFLIDPIVNGRTTNPYFLAYGGGLDVSTMRMQFGGIDACYYYEFGGPTNSSYGPSDVRYNVIRCSFYGISTVQAGNPRILFTSTNPMAVSGYLMSKANSAAAPGNAAASLFPGFVIKDGVINASDIAFDAPPAGVSLPIPVNPHQVYTIAGYAYGYLTVTANNVTGAVVGDVFAFTTGVTIDGVANGGTPALRTQVQATAVSNGVPTAFKLVHPGAYKYRPTSLVMSPVAGATGTGTITVAQASYPGDAVATSFVIQDANGNFIDNSASTVGTASPAGTTPVSSGLPSASSVVTNTVKTQNLGMCRFHDNWLQGSPIRFMKSVKGPSFQPAQAPIADADGNLRLGLDIFSHERDRWLFGAPQSSPDPGDGNGPLVSIFLPSVISGALDPSTAAVNPAPGAITGLAITGIGATSVSLSFNKDPNARISPDSYSPNNPSGYVPFNPSGYQYRLTTPPGGTPGSWKSVPALSKPNSTQRTVTITDAALGPSKTSTLEIRSVSTYNTPSQAPQQFGLVSSASVTTPAS